MRVLLVLLIGLLVGNLFSGRLLAEGFVADRYLIALGEHSEISEQADDSLVLYTNLESEIADWSLYKDPYSQSSQYYNQPTGIWLTGSPQDLKIVKRAIVFSKSSVPVFVLYFSPSQKSRYPSAFQVEDYLQRNREIAQVVRDHRAIIIVEPDSLCLYHDTITAQGHSQKIVRDVVAIYRKQCANARIYLDAGHSSWVLPRKMARILKKSGIDQADGFATNVSNFQHTKDEVEYAQKLSGLLSGKRFVIDTGRNGNGLAMGSAHSLYWSDPQNISTGIRPTTVTPHKALDAYLWVKPPGEADGTAFPAGSWHPELIIYRPE